MIAYVDASVLLRRLLHPAGALVEWPGIERAVVSALVEVECLRTLDRLRHERRVSDLDSTRLHEGLHRFLASAEIVELTPHLLAEAGRPLPTTLGTLDAIHLATALAWQASERTALTLATHDEALALAARAHGLPVVGVPADVA